MRTPLLERGMLGREFYILEDNVEELPSHRQEFGCEEVCEIWCYWKISSNLQFEFSLERK